MGTAGLSLVGRTHRMYYRLLVLERVFRNSGESSDQQEVDDSDAPLFEGVREMLAGLAEEARIMATVPYPISEWRPGDDSFDPRWRSLSQLERREMRGLVRAYENLIDYCETLMAPDAPAPDAGEGVDVNWHRITVRRVKSELAFFLADANETGNRQAGDAAPTRRAQV